MPGSKTEPQQKLRRNRGGRSKRGTSCCLLAVVMSVSQITPTLFLSSADAAQNQALVSRKGITLIVNATLTQLSPSYRGVQCLRVPVSDLPHAPLGDHFERVAKRIHNNRTGSTLVHCAAGMSRSPSLVMAYLMRYKGTTLREAHRWVQESRPCIRPNSGFWQQLLRYEKTLYGKNTVTVAPSLELNSGDPPINFSLYRSPRRAKYSMYR
ncbi:dual specificity protein phosphatase 18 isoform X2 [Conger conger]|nr:dual specificity protein phosphatase 18 isoform X2 [Conger conger]